MEGYKLVPVELLERCVRANDEAQPSKLFADLRAVLDSPVPPQALSAASPATIKGEVARCMKCDRTTVEQCDDAGCGFLGAGNGAPVVERQELVYQLKNKLLHAFWRNADKKAYDSAEFMPRYERRILYEAPPQLAELQAEIETLTISFRQEQIKRRAEIDELQATIERQADLLRDAQIDECLNANRPTPNEAPEDHGKHPDNDGLEDYRQ